MKKLYGWQRRWKRTKHRKEALFLAGTVLIVVALLGCLAIFIILVGLRFPILVPDFGSLRNIALIGLFVIGALIYWVIVGIIFYRWFKAQLRRNRVSVQALNTARLVRYESPKGVVSSNARQGGPVSAASLSPAEFEQEVAWVLSKRFGIQAEVVGKANDGGIDIKLYDNRGSLIAIVQAKRYDERKALNPGFLRELDSCKRRMGVPSAYLVTTARFSADVRRQAQEMHIDLVDGRLFHEWRQSVYALPESSRPPNSSAQHPPRR